MVAKITYPKLAFTRQAPDAVRAVVNKLVREPGNGSAPHRAAEQQVNVSRELFERISKTTGQDSIDADSVFQLLPDVELANQILVGSIISPKDMSSVELDFTIADHQFDSELSRSLLGVIEQHFKVDYKIDDRLDAILEEIMFTKGAHILVTLPENNLDHLINGSSRLSLESFNQVIKRINAEQPMGFLGHPREARVALESFRDRNHTADRVGGKLVLAGSKGTGDKHVDIPYLRVTDNFEALKLPNVETKRRGLQIGRLINKHHVSMESAARGLSPADIDKLYTRTPAGNEPTQVVMSQSYMQSQPVGHPLVLKLPIEAVIPVYVPGEPGEHIGYFIMIDQHGRPVTREENRDYYGELRNNFRTNSQDNSSELVRQIKDAMGGAAVKQDLEYDQIHNAYTAIIENDLINRLRNGIYGEEFSIGTTEEIYRIMLYRSLKAKQTQLLYVPAELVTYMAFAYNEQGIGQTLLTQSKILASMRTVLMFAETMSGVRNAIGRKRASITVDPHDPDPQKTISDVQTAVLESSRRGFPLGSPDPAQTMDYLNRAGYDFSINVDSDDYPTTKVEFDDYNTQVNAGNQELQDRLRRMHIAGMGLSPEWVDPQQSPEFAVSVVNNNLIMTRRVLRYQKRFTEFLSKFVRTYTQHSSTLRAALAELVTTNRQKLAPHLKDKNTDEVLDEFIQSIKATLPAPDTTKVELQLQAFDQYTQLLDRALEAYITADLFPAEVLAREPDMINLVITTVRAYYQRTWLERNNVMPELDQLTQMDGRKPSFNLLEIQEGHFGGLGEAIHRYITGVNKKKEKWEKKYQADLDAGTQFNSDELTDTMDVDGGDSFGDMGEPEELEEELPDTTLDEEAEVAESDSVEEEELPELELELDEDELASADEEQTDVSDEDPLEEEGKPNRGKKKRKNK